MNEPADVVVVGAGPAGAAAAIELARGGRSVVLIDKATFPRDKCCGDGLTAGALRWLEHLGLEVDAVESWQPVTDVVLRSPSGRVVRLPLPRDGRLHAAVARRADLDSRLLDVARAAGATVLEASGAASVAPDSDGVVVTLEDGERLNAAYVVAADGMWSRVRKSLGLNEPGYLGEWHAFRQYFAAVAQPATELWVWFEADLLPGYAWSFPLPGGRANVGFGVQREVGRATGDMGRLWPELLQRPQFAAVLGPEARAEAPHKTWPIPAAVGRTPLTGLDGRVLFAGDAARATDPLTGEGIGQALETGILAARSVLGAGVNPAAVGRTYAREVRRALATDHTLGRLLSRALRHRKAARGALRIADSTAWTRREFGRWLFEDYPRAALLTPRRWGSTRWRGGGAYRASR